ncbi:conserved hypothetical protein [Talaromyces stipitatus ATCC 10500]|uniref:NmrA-like domain-containing protein n=1 Tax=Talaromyces stipitatus (strain ATCC 10500 / CBS 375.48 / QM 6759 / NRRL 1006) TaxID=441959 RepID=B8MEW3_TALSN|nr:uncharacterized protein TSTA_023000 [Talaromyces stipitatus ATCC 10500]EED17246.1 conserved hypothetical protein [Talaromyces stipitatus ATCC 10500]
MALRNVLIIGAGGHLGPSILAAFRNDSRFNVSVLSRQSSSSKFPKDTKVHRVGDDYPDEGVLSAFKDQDAVISTIATASAGQQTRFIDLAIKAGVKRFVPSEFGSDTRVPSAMDILPQYFGGKQATVDYLISKEKEGLTWSSFVTGPFFELAMAGFMGFDIPNRKATIYNDGEGSWSTTTLPSIGIALKNSLIEFEKTANRYIYVASFTVKQNEVLKALEKVTGSKFDVEYVDGEAQRAIGTEKISQGDFSGAMLLIRYINSVDGNGGNYALYHPTDNKLLSLPEETLEEELKKIVSQ